MKYTQKTNENRIQWENRKW